MRIPHCSSTRCLRALFRIPVSICHVLSSPSLLFPYRQLKPNFPLTTRTSTPLSTPTRSPQPTVTPSKTTRGTRRNSATTSGIVPGRRTSTFHFTGYELKALLNFEDKTYLDLDDLSDFSKITKGSTGDVPRFCDQISVSHVSCGSGTSPQRRLPRETVGLERGDRESGYCQSFVSDPTPGRDQGIVTDVEGSILRKCRRNSAQSHSHTSHVTEHKFHTDDRDLQELRSKSTTNHYVRQFSSENIVFD